MKALNHMLKSLAAFLICVNMSALADAMSTTAHTNEVAYIRVTDIPREQYKGHFRNIIMDFEKGDMSFQHSTPFPVLRLPRTKGRP